MPYIAYVHEAPIEDARRRPRSQGVGARTGSMTRLTGAGGIIALQRAAGNKAVASILRPDLPSGAQPGVVQRQQSSNAKKAARAKVVAAMDQLKAKYGLNEVSEEPGVAWSESELRILDAAFSRMSKAEQAKLKGVSLVRADKLFFEHKGKQLKVIGLGGRVIIKLTAAGVRDPLAPLHEAGHMLHKNAVFEADQRLRRSKEWANVESTRIAYRAAISKIPQRYPAKDEQQSESFGAFKNAMIAASNAAGSLLDADISEEAEVAAASKALDEAELLAEGERSSVERYRSDPIGKVLLEAHDRERAWLSAIQLLMTERAQQLRPRKELTSFVELVKKHKLDRRSFAPFTAHVQKFWPDPGEFFAQCYATWRKNPDYLEKNAKALFEWFEKGSHLLSPDAFTPNPSGPFGPANK